MVVSSEGVTVLVAKGPEEHKLEQNGARAQPESRVIEWA